MYNTIIKRRINRVIAMSLFAIGITTAADSLAAEAQNPFLTNPLLNNPLLQTTCLQVAMQVCGTTFVVPGGTLGNLQTFPMPDRFQTSSFSVQCVTDGGYPYYRYIGNEVSCALKTCGPMNVSVCGTSVPIETTASVGDIIETPIPAEILAANYQNPPPTISARCDMINGTPTYEVENDGGLSCNAFLCKPVTLGICDSSVTITEATALGTVLQATTQNNQPVTVECLGSQGAPHYVITAHTCN